MVFPYKSENKIADLFRKTYIFKYKKVHNLVPQIYFILCNYRVACRNQLKVNKWNKVY